MDPFKTYEERTWHWLSKESFLSEFYIDSQLVKRKGRPGKKRYCASPWHEEEEDKSQHMKRSILRGSGKWSFTSKKEGGSGFWKLCSEHNPFTDPWLILQNKTSFSFKNFSWSPTESFFSGVCSTVVNTCIVVNNVKDLSAQEVLKEI